jgi:hypothetical protein
LTSKQRLTLLLSGRPNETESDNCISLLIHPLLCGTSPTCWNIMANEDEEIHGYSLMHRLLYFQVARQVSCNVVTGLDSKKYPLHRRVKIFSKCVFVYNYLQVVRGQK